MIFRLGMLQALVRLLSKLYFVEKWMQIELVVLESLCRVVSFWRKALRNTSWYCEQTRPPTVRTSRWRPRTTRRQPPLRWPPQHLLFISYYSCCCYCRSWTLCFCVSAGRIVGTTLGINRGLIASLQLRYHLRAVDKEFTAHFTWNQCCCIKYLQNCHFWPFKRPLIIAVDTCSLSRLKLIKSKVRASTTFKVAVLKMWILAKLIRRRIRVFSIVWFPSKIQVGPANALLEDGRYM